MTRIPRRVVLTGLATVPFVAQLTRAGRPAFAQTGLETVNLTISGGRTVAGVVATPAVVPAPAVLLFHGSSGLTEMYRAFAPAFARDGFLAPAPDRFDGQTATDERARARRRSEVRSHWDKAEETVAAWLASLKADNTCNGKIGVVGWSFGAEWA